MKVFLLLLLLPTLAFAQTPTALDIVRTLRNDGLPMSQGPSYSNHQTIQITSSDSLPLVHIVTTTYDSVEAGHTQSTKLWSSQTAALPSMLSLVSNIQVFDLYTDRIPLPNYIVTGPLGKYGELDYDFSIESETSTAYHIRFKHHGDVFPGFDGSMLVAKSPLSLKQVEFGANEGTKLGVLKDLHWRQDYSSYSNKTVLASSLFSAIARTQIGMLPKYGVHIANRLAYGVRETLESEKQQTLSDPYDLRYISSTPAIDVFTLPERSWGSFLRQDAISSLLYNPDIIQYNRVEGLRLELRERLNEIGLWPLAIDARGAYGFSDKKYKYDVELTQGIFWHKVQTVTTSVGLSGKFNTSVRTIPDPWLSVGARLVDDRAMRGTSRSTLMNTISALGYKSDFPDYYWTKGITPFIEYEPLPLLSIQVAYKAEKQSSIDSTPKATFSLLKSKSPFRSNPPINDGNLRELRGTINYNSLPEGFGQGRQLYSRLELAHAGTNWNSDFDYSLVQVHLAVSLPAQQWGMSTVYFDAASKLAGALGNQHLFLFETPRGFSNRTRAFLTIKNREFQGDRVAMLMLEQDMYDLPVRALGLHFLAPLELHWFAFANIGHSSVSSETKSLLRVPVRETGNVPYAEAGLGIGNIINLIRLDAAFRLTHKEAIGSGFALIATLGLTL